MKVNATTLVVAAGIGLAIGAFATGQVGGVVLPLLFVLACPLMLMFLLAGTPGGRAGDRAGGPGERRAPRAGRPEEPGLQPLSGRSRRP